MGAVSPTIPRVFTELGAACSHEDQNEPAKIPAGSRRLRDRYPPAGSHRMIIGSLQHAHAATITGSGGVKTYIDDMNLIGTVLRSSPQSFSWWTVVLLVLILLAWCAALTAAWIYLMRRIGRSANPGGESISTRRDRPLLIADAP